MIKFWQPLSEEVLFQEHQLSSSKKSYPLPFIRKQIHYAKSICNRLYGTMNNTTLYMFLLFSVFSRPSSSFRCFRFFLHSQKFRCILSINGSGFLSYMIFFKNVQGDNLDFHTQSM